MTVLPPIAAFSPFIMYESFSSPRHLSGKQLILLAVGDQLTVSSILSSTLIHFVPLPWQLCVYPRDDCFSQGAQSLDSSHLSRDDSLQHRRLLKMGKQRYVIRI